MSGLLVELRFFPLKVKEFEISKTAAERSLRENDGDIIKALRALTD